MDRSWDFIFESTDSELLALKTSLEETKDYFVSCGLKEMFNRGFDAKYMLESIFDIMDLDPNVTYYNFLRQLFPANEEISDVEVEDQVIANLIYEYILTLDSALLSKFLSIVGVLDGPEILLKTEILRRLKSSDIFRSVAPHLLLSFYLNDGKKIVSDTSFLILSSAKCISLLSKLNASLLIPGGFLGLAVYNAYKNITSESKKFVLPLPIIVAIIYLHNNCSSKLDSEESANKYVDGLIRYNKIFDTHDDSILSIIFSLIEENIKDEEYGIDLDNLVYSTLKDKKLEIPDRIKDQLCKYRDTLIYSLMCRLNFVDDIHIEKYKQYSEIFNNFGYESDCKILFYDYVFPYLNLRIADNCYFYEKKYNSNIYKVADFLYLASKGINPFLHVKNNFDEDDFKKIAYDGDLREVTQVPGIEYIDIAREYNQLKDLFNQPISNIQVDEEDVSNFVSLLLSGDIGEVEKISNFCKSDLDLKKIGFIYDVVLTLRKKIDSMSNMAHTLRHEFAPRMKDVKKHIIRTTNDDEEQKKELLSKVKSIEVGLDTLIKIIDSPNSIKNVNLTNMLEQIKNEYENGLFQIQFEFDKEYCVIVTESFKQSVLYNILENAKRHAFVVNSLKNIVKFEILPDPENEKKILLRISNNGVPFTGNTQEVFNFKFKYGQTGHSGEGLYYAKQSLILCNSDIKMYSYPEKEFCVVFEIKLNLDYQDTFENK